MLSCVRAGAVESELEKELGALRKEEAILKVPSLSLALSRARSLSRSLSTSLALPLFWHSYPATPKKPPCLTARAHAHTQTRTHKHKLTLTHWHRQQHQSLSGCCKSGRRSERSPMTCRTSESGFKANGFAVSARCGAWREPVFCIGVFMYMFMTVDL